MEHLAHQFLCDVQRSDYGLGYKFYLVRFLYKISPDFETALISVGKDAPHGRFARMHILLKESACWLLGCIVEISIALATTGSPAPSCSILYRSPHPCNQLSVIFLCDQNV